MNFLVTITRISLAGICLVMRPCWLATVRILELRTKPHSSWSFLSSLHLLRFLMGAQLCPTWLGSITTTPVRALYRQLSLTLLAHFPNISPWEVFPIDFYLALLFLCRAHPSLCPSLPFWDLLRFLPFSYYPHHLHFTHFRALRSFTYYPNFHMPGNWGNLLI